MKVIDILKEAPTPKPKKRPPKDFWYKDDSYWRHDIEHRIPGIRYLGDEENEEVFAVSPDDENDCFGVWRFKDGMGTTFHKPRMLRIVAQPRARFSDYQIPSRHMQENRKMKVKEIFEEGMVTRSMGNERDTVLQNLLYAVTKGRESLGVNPKMKWFQALRELGISDEVLSSDAHIQTGAPSWRPMRKVVSKYLELRSGNPNAFGRGEVGQFAKIISNWADEVREAGKNSVFRR